MAAGRGERMRPLTDTVPKPLLKVHGKPLIQYHIEALATAGVSDIVVNVAWLAEQLIGFLGDGAQFGVSIHISHEYTALESGGGLVQALPLLGDEPFIAVNGDTYTDYNYQQLSGLSLGDKLAHLVMVPNPSHNPEGDFGLQGNVVNLTAPKYTFSGIRVFSPALLAGKPHEYFSIVPSLKEAIAAGLVSGDLHKGTRVDVGTPERLAQLNS